MRLPPLSPLGPLVLGALVLALGAAEARAQSTRDHGSVYSAFGLGERVSVASSQSQMMGGAGVGLRSFTYVGLENPALWGDLVLTQFTAGAQLQGLRAEDGAGGRAELTSGTFGGLALGVPLRAGRLGLVLGFRPYSRVNYLTVREGTVADPHGELPGPDIPYRVNFEGDGGLQQLRLGLGYRLGEAVSVGASLDALFGTVEHRQRTEFLASSLAETRTTERTQLSGLGATLGAAASASGVLGEGDVLSFGAALTLPTRLSGERTETLGLSLDQDTLRAAASGSVSVPMRLVAGLAYVPDARWALAADVHYEPWGSFEGDFALGGYDPAAGAEQLRDRLRLGGGVQFSPAGADRSRAYFARTAYRLGAYYESGLAAPLAEGRREPAALSTLALTGGLSLPALLPTARFDLGFELGTRGSTEGGLVRDLFVRGSATINFGERWFRRRALG